MAKSRDLCRMRNRIYKPGLVKNNKIKSHQDLSPVSSSLRSCTLNHLFLFLADVEMEHTQEDDKQFEDAEK